MSLNRELKQLRRIYKNVELGEIAKLWMRRARCAARSLASPPTPRSTTGVRWIVSLTTLPSRIHRIRGTLNSLLDQTEPADEIVLAVPNFSRREQASYRIPNWLERSKYVTILPCEDLGPATKLLPVLKRTENPETRIAVVDDDVVYPPDFLANLQQWSRRYPNSAVAYSGWTLTNSLKYRDSQVSYGTELRFPKAVDVLRGTWGYVVRRGFFDDRVFDFASVPNECYFVDDVFFSARLAERGIERLAIPCRLPPMSTWSTRVGGLSYQENSDGRNNQSAVNFFRELWAAYGKHSNARLGATSSVRAA